SYFYYVQTLDYAGGCGYGPLSRGVYALPFHDFPAPIVRLDLVNCMVKVSWFGLQGGGGTCQPARSLDVYRGTSAVFADAQRLFTGLDPYGGPVFDTNA